MPDADGIHSGAAWRLLKGGKGREMGCGKGKKPFAKVSLLQTEGTVCIKK